MHDRIQSGGAIESVVETLAYPWLRHNGATADAARILAQDVRAEIASGNWRIGQRIPELAWLADKARSSVDVAAAALALLAQDGWAAVDSAGQYLVSIPVPLSIPEPYRRPTPPTRLEKPRHSAITNVVGRGPRKPSHFVAPPQAPARRILSYITYVLGIDGLPFVKIGHTTQSPEKRLKSLQTGQPMSLRLLWQVPGDFESALHTHFAPYRVRGEWFDLTSLGDLVDVVKTAVGEIEASRV